MRAFMKWLLAITVVGTTCITSAYAGFYGERFCDDPRFDCVRVRSGETWNTLWPNQREQLVVRKLNRLNISLFPGLVVAVPKDLSNLDVMDISPFRHYIAPPGRKIIIVDQRRLAWGAYDANGELVRWGPTSSGRGYCPDLHSRCRTPTGTYSVYSKEGPGCISSKFPIGRGGAPMPYCMFFHGGYALHGSPTVPGFNASHGCVRLFYDDAKWLNQNFVGIGTAVRVEPF